MNNLDDFSVNSTNFVFEVLNYCIELLECLVHIYLKSIRNLTQTCPVYISGFDFPLLVYPSLQIYTSISYITI